MVPALCAPFLLCGYLLLTHCLVIGQESFVGDEGAILFIGKVRLELQPHLVPLGHKFPGSWVVALG